VATLRCILCKILGISGNLVSRLKSNAIYLVVLECKESQKNSLWFIKHLSGAANCKVELAIPVSQFLVNCLSLVHVSKFDDQVMLILAWGQIEENVWGF
jgi:hypothetical protein